MVNVNEYCVDAGLSYELKCILTRFVEERAPVRMNIDGTYFVRGLGNDTNYDKDNHDRNEQQGPQPKWPMMCLHQDNRTLSTGLYSKSLIFVKDPCEIKHHQTYQRWRIKSC